MVSISEGETGRERDCSAPAAAGASSLDSVWSEARALLLHDAAAMGLPSSLQRYKGDAETRFERGRGGGGGGLWEEKEVGREEKRMDGKVGRVEEGIRVAKGETAAIFVNGEGGRG